MSSFYLLILFLILNLTTAKIVGGESKSTYEKYSWFDLDVSRVFDQNVSTFYHSDRGSNYEWAKLYLDKPRKVKQVEIVNR